MKIALSILCEHPSRRTGLTTTYHEFVARSLKLFPDVRWVVFVGPNQPYGIEDRRVEVVRDFPANDRLGPRLLADHLRVPAAARARGADMMVSTGFVPWRKCLPTVMHVFSLQHLNRENRVGLARECYRWLVMRHSWQKADLIITNSRFAKGQILKVFPQFADRLVQAYEGLQHEQFHPQSAAGEKERLKTQFGLEPGYFLWISNFYPYKQGDLLIAAYAGLDPETRRRHPLVMVGGDWLNQLALCRGLARQLGVENEVKFLQWVGDEWLAPLYRHGLAFCLPSREETFGRCITESMACGLPCLVNDIPIMHEVTDGQAVIVNYSQTRETTKALQQLAKDESLRARLRTGGLRRAQDFTFEKFTSERILGIQRLLAGRQKKNQPIR